ncbi:MAG: CoA transferase, partial [Chloroflexota bacterium]|nr:CoA transferase [Chloroflexota bacterium]
LLEWTMIGTDPQRRGNRDPHRAPQGVYPSAGEDRWVAISVEDDAMWGAFRGALGDPAWARDPALGTLEGRQARHDDIDRELSAWTAGRTSHEAAAVLQAAGVAATPVLDGPDLVDDPQLRHRGFFVDIDHPEVGVTASAGIPLWFSETQLHYGSAPLLGEHNREVFTDLVGLEPEEFERLVRDSVIV